MICVFVSIHQRFRPRACCRASRPSYSARSISLRGSQTSYLCIRAADFFQTLEQLSFSLRHVLSAVMTNHHFLGRCFVIVHLLRVEIHVHSHWLASAGARSVRIYILNFLAKSSLQISSPSLPYQIPPRVQAIGGLEVKRF